MYYVVRVDWNECMKENKVSKANDNVKQKYFDVNMMDVCMHAVSCVYP